MKEELTVYNIPKNVLFQFSTSGSYIIKVDRSVSLGGNYIRDISSTFTEVYNQDENGDLYCTLSGGLTQNPHVFGKNGIMGDKVFNIFSYDMDTSADFAVDMPLKEADEEISKQVPIPMSSRTR